ncbi:MAG: hypothetical protein LBS38_00295 [Endomicrobium sp.]|jgi:hypothetical protein|nr:hypothetical protein [Endomicrobium sp.]
MDLFSILGPVGLNLVGGLINTKMSSDLNREEAQRQRDWQRAQMIDENMNRRRDIREQQLERAREAEKNRKAELKRLAFAQASGDRYDNPFWNIVSHLSK